MAGATSIMDSVKEALGVPTDQSAFDTELMIHINSSLSTLRQLGVGPVDGMMITDNTTTWTDFLGDRETVMNDAKAFMVLRVKLVFDPPPTSFVIDAMKEQIQEATFRLNVTREETDWVDPNPPAPVDPYADPMLF